MIVVADGKFVVFFTVVVVVVVFPKFVELLMVVDDEALSVSGGFV